MQPYLDEIMHLVWLQVVAGPVVCACEATSLDIHILYHLAPDLWIRWRLRAQSWHGWA